ncbi:MAG: protein translocase subunit SecD [Phycisphaeraceae bacterium]|nr:protein translocase subunit SecD [Phycisphaeraceae bacterium]
MGKLYRNFCIVLAIILFFAWQIFPPAERLRLGKDLAGGVTLIYQVEIGQDEDAKKVVADTIEVLKNRVDPDGLMEISMVSQGRDRIEISMPLPRAEVKELKAKFEEQLRRLGRNSLSRERIAELLTLQGEARTKRIAEMADGNEKRKAALDRLVAESDQAALFRSEIAKAKEANAPVSEIDILVDKAGEAEIKIEDATKAALATVLPPAEIRQALTLSDRKRSIEDKNGQRIQLPSAREHALQRIRESYPDAKEQLDTVLAAYGNYAKKRTTLDDPQDLVRMLQGAGVLSFRITVDPGRRPDEEPLREELRTKGPRAAKPPEAMWARINQIDGWYHSKQDLQFLEANPAAFFRDRNYIVEEYQGQYYMLVWDIKGSRLTKADGEWSVSRAQEGRDARGVPAIDFVMDAPGATRLGELTKDHVGERMAVLLDNEVYTAPTLNSAISKSGQITGEFSADERRYIIRVLAAGSLQAKLSPEPISISSVGPQLGADNLLKGFKAGIVSIIVISSFMVVYYFGAGVVSVIALCANAILILGALAMNHAAFSMPGIAAIILTFGMAVDSNVLIYERIREEILRGADTKTAVRIGFDKALSSIVDGNVTNLIVCIVLAYTGTQEIRGFAITMGIGVVSTLFCALVFSRILFGILLGWGWKRVNMLPLAVPALQRALTPNVDWLRLRPFFFAFSAAYVIIGLGFVFFQGRDMLDNEFRGGTAVTLEFKPTAPGSDQHVTLERSEVKKRLDVIANGAPADSPLRELINAEVLPIDPERDGVTSWRFTVKTIATKSDQILEALVDNFTDVMEQQPALRFRDSDADASNAPVHRVTTGDLGTNIGATLEPARNVGDSIGGVAIVLDNITPPVPLATLQQRLESSRSGSDFADTLGRKRSIIVTAGTAAAVKSAVVVVYDDNLKVFDSETRWTEQLAAREWQLVATALTQAQIPASVVIFSPAIAESFRAQAIVATTLSFVLISIYIWIRFKSLRFSAAALIALVHDVVVVVSCLALSQLLYQNSTTEPIAQALGILPFRIDLNMIAALLTIAGYSLNDTIVIMDRIRETKGKSAEADYDMINTAVNHTLSRTVITGGTTLFSCVALYVMGGEGMRSFAFALTIGLIVGTYSSVGVAAPLVWSGKRRKADEQVQPVRGTALAAR